MGILKQGILGNVSGKVGNVIGGTWKGIGTVRIVPSSVSNPQTAGQVEQRSRMSGAVSFAQGILSTWIKPLFDRFASKQSGFNAWIQANIALFVAGVLTVPANLIMSIGNMAATAISNVEGAGGDATLSLSWVSDTVGFHLATDVAYACAVSSTGDLLGVVSGSSRSSEEAVIGCNRELIAAEKVYIFLVFKRTNGLYVSLTESYEYTVEA